jgi:hypothetical protein
MTPKERQELTREAKAATDEQLRAEIAYYRMHVGAKKSRGPGWLQGCKEALAIFEVELALRKGLGQTPS